MSPIAKAKFDVARRTDGKYRHKAFDNTPEGFALFAEWLAGFRDASPAVCMEATGAYSVPLAECLAAQGFRVSVVNPAKIAASTNAVSNLPCPGAATVTTTPPSRASGVP